jgi:hypothetical protein
VIDSVDDSECRRHTFVFRLANVAIKRIFLLDLYNNLRTKATILGEEMILQSMTLPGSLQSLEQPQWHHK